MSFNKLSQDRIQFVRKTYFEIFNSAMSIAHDIYNNSSSNSSDLSPTEIRKNTFLSLVNGNKELLPNEKEYCKKRYTNDVELQHAMHKDGIPRECKKCNATRY